MSIVILLVCATTAASSLVADTEFGKVEGQQREVNGVTVKSWLGVPYAASPEGNLRWKPPTNPQAWSSILRTDTTFMCPQFNYGKFQGNENACLQANIFAPTVKTGTPINNVMVWIHGGSHINTTPLPSTVDGSKLVARSATSGEPVIVVTVGYRLGGLGFMAMPELTAESPDKSSGNYATLDQIFALKWIKRNIHAFGGSTKLRVTLFGQSAGAYSIATLLASPLATDLFDAAIMESGNHALGWKPLSFAEKTGTACSVAHCKDAKDKLACLRALPAEKAYYCQAVVLKTGANQFHTIENPNVDGHVLKCSPLEALQASAAGSRKCGKLSQAPIMIGSNTAEGNGFASRFVGYPGVAVTGPIFAQFIIGVFKSGEKVGVHDFEALYPAKNYVATAAKLKFLLGKTISPNAAAIADMMGDAFFTCSAEFTASAIAVMKSSRKAYLYSFDHTPSHMILSLGGVTHSWEVPYVFGNFDEFAAELTRGRSTSWAPTAFEQKLSQNMMDYWLNFARYSNPNTKDTVAKWPPAGCGEENNYMVFGKDGAVPSIGKPFHHHDQCKVWGSYSGLPLSTCASTVTFGYAHVAPTCPRGFWASGCGQPASKQTGSVVCMNNDKADSFIYADSMCAGKKPKPMTYDCPETAPCPRCKGCKRNGDCWQACGKKAGLCAACDSADGTPGACCLPGSKDDPVECRISEPQLFAAVKDKHTCALMPGDSHVGGLIKSIIQRLQNLEGNVEDLKDK